MKESFNARFRMECLNEHWFLTLDNTRGKIEVLAAEEIIDEVAG